MPVMSESSCDDMQLRQKAEAEEDPEGAPSAAMPRL